MGAKTNTYRCTGCRTPLRLRDSGPQECIRCESDDTEYSLVPMELRLEKKPSELNGNESNGKVGRPKIKRNL